MMTTVFAADDDLEERLPERQAVVYSDNGMATLGIRLFSPGVGR